MRKLDRGDLVRFADGACRRVLCIEGMLWITQAGDARDHFLGPGEALVLDHCLATLIEACDSAILRIDLLPRSAPRRGWTPAGHGACRTAPE